MGARRFRWWHGCVAGLLVGTALWRADVALEGWAEPAVVNGVDVREFTRLMRAAASGPGPGGRPVVEDLTVHPEVEGRHVVTGRAVVGRWSATMVKSFEFVAPVPFVVRTESPAANSGLGALAQALFGGSAPRPAPAVQARTYPNVQEYLKEVAPSVSYRYVWWEEPRAKAGLWIGGPTLLLGGVLPAVLALLVRLGLIARPVEEPEVVLPERLSGEDPADQKPAVDTAAVTAQLDAAIEAAERNLGEEGKGVGAVAGVGATPDVPPAPVRLSGQGEPLTAVPEEKEEKTYDRGEFYPVSRGSGPKH